MKHYIYRLSFFLLAHTKAYAAVPTLDSILKNITDLIGPFYVLFGYISYVIGAWLLFKGVMELRNMGAALTQANKPGEFSGPLVEILVGALFIYIGPSIDSIGFTLFGEDSVKLSQDGNSILDNEWNTEIANILGYVLGGDLSTRSSEVLHTALLLMTLIGFISVLRGLLILSQAGKPGGQPGSMPKGFIHLIGGVLLINIGPLINALSNTLFA